MRRLLAAAGAAALGLAIVMPVARAVVPPGGGTSLDWWTPVKYDQNGNAQPQPSTAPDGTAVYSTDEVVTVKAHFTSSGSTPGGVKSWDVQLVPASGGRPSTCHEDITPENGRYTDDAYISCPWDTTRAVDRTVTTPSSQVQDQGLRRNWHLDDHGPSVNGKYTIQVWARTAGQVCGLLTGCTQDGSKEVQYELYQDPSALRWRQMYVTNDVTDPTGVNSTFDAATNRINVTWAANPEPDVSYIVQEKVGDGKWSAGVAVPGSATNYVRAIDQPGKYQYQVAATRPAPTADSGKGASATKTSNYVAAQAVTVAQVVPPTTAPSANGPDGTIDNSDAGVNLPTNAPSSSTAPGSHGSAPGNGAPAAAAGRAGGFAIAPRPGTASRPTGSTAPAGGEAEGEGVDNGFSSTLPYNQAQNGSADGLGAGDEEPQSMGNIVKVPRPQDARALLVPLAGGLAMFVFAMQVTVLIRRRPAMASVEHDFDDWMGF